MYSQPTFMSCVIQEPASRTEACTATRSNLHSLGHPRSSPQERLHSVAIPCSYVIEALFIMGSSIPFQHASCTNFSWRSLSKGSLEAMVHSYGPRILWGRPSSLPELQKSQRCSPMLLLCSETVLAYQDNCPLHLGLPRALPRSH